MISADPNHLRLITNKEYIMSTKQNTNVTSSTTKLTDTTAKVVIDADELGEQTGTIHTDIPGVDVEVETTEKDISDDFIIRIPKLKGFFRNKKNLWIAVGGAVVVAATAYVKFAVNNDVTVEVTPKNEEFSEVPIGTENLAY